MKRGQVWWYGWYEAPSVFVSGSVKWNEADNAAYNVQVSFCTSQSTWNYLTKKHSHDDDDVIDAKHKWTIADSRFRPWLTVSNYWSLSLAKFDFNLSCYACRTLPVPYGHCENMTSSTKPEVHNISQRRQRSIEPWPYPQKCKSSAVWFSYYANRRTDKHTPHNISQYFK